MYLGLNPALLGDLNALSGLGQPVEPLLRPNFDSAKVWSTGKPNKC